MTEDFTDRKDRASAWFRSLRDQCTAHDVPFFFKSWGDWSDTNVDLVACSDLDAYGWWTETGFAPHGVGSRFDGQMCMFRVGKARSGRLLDGAEHNAIPVVRG